MATINPKYTGYDFKEWYKTIYGEDYNGQQLKRDGVEGVDWDWGQELFKQYNAGLVKEGKDEQALTDYNSANATTDRVYDTQKQTATETYNKNTTDLLANYTRSNELIEKNRQRALEASSITFDKLKKYLPEQLKAQGLGGVGMSESAILQAYNNMMTQRGQAEGQFLDTKGELERNYSSAKLGYDTNFNNELTRIEGDRELDKDKNLAVYNETLGKNEDEYNLIDVYGATGGLIDKHQGIEDSRMETNYTTIQGSLNYYDGTDDAFWVNKVNEAYNNGDITKERRDALLVDIQTITGRNANTACATALVRADNAELDGNWESALNEMNSAKPMFEKAGRLSEWQSEVNRYQGKIDEKNKQEADAKAKADQEEKDKRILEGKEYIEYDGSQYKIKSQLNENSNEIGHNRDFTKQIKDRFGTKNPYDSKIPNGTVLTLKCDSKGKNEVNYEDFGLADVTDWRNWIPGYNIYNQITKWGNFETRYVAYYNGNWYSVDKK